MQPSGIMNQQSNSDMSSVVESKPEVHQSEDGSSSGKPPLDEERVLVTDEDVSPVLTFVKGKAATKSRSDNRVKK